MRVNLFWLGVVIAAGSGLVPVKATAAPSGPSIAIKFAADEPEVGGAAERSDVEGPAGVLKTKNWNNFEGTNSADAESLVKDVAGVSAATPATVEWTSANTWSSDGRGGEDINDVDEGPDRALMLGYLDNNPTTPVTINVAGLPSDFTSNGYDVYVYILGGVLDRGGDYQIGDKVIEHNVIERFDGTFVKGEEGNYLVFEDLKTPSFELTATAVRGGTPRGPINAIEIAARVAAGVAGDFDGNGTLEVSDLNALCSAVMAGGNNAKYDLNADAKVDGQDHKLWVTTLKKTWIGDANLDGAFNSGDLVAVFTVGKYETGSTANWQEGDFNCDGKFDSGDFVAAFSDGGYEVGPRAAVSAVPEPATGFMGVLALLGLLAVRRSR